VDSPSTTITTGDGHTAASYVGSYRWWMWSDNQSGNSAGSNRVSEGNSYGHLRHRNLANYGFLDGHVVRMRAEDIPCSPTECWWSMDEDPH
jgi:prepilin-type processing-associated H-X9-DG protein